jgi:hypothetical protein
MSNKVTLCALGVKMGILPMSAAVCALKCFQMNSPPHFEQLKAELLICRHIRHGQIVGLLYWKGGFNMPFV